MLVTQPIPAEIDLLALHRHAPSRYPMLLESAAHGTAQGRWDLLLMHNGESLSLDASNIVRRHDGVVVGTDFLSALDVEWKQHQIAREEPRWPFRGVGLYRGYELAAQVEPILQTAGRTGRVSVGTALRCPGGITRSCNRRMRRIAEMGCAAMLDDIVDDSIAAKLSNPSSSGCPRSNLKKTTRNALPTALPHSRLPRCGRRFPGQRVARLACRFKGRIDPARCMRDA